ncbi:MAG: glutathione S-transferase family protein [Rhodobacterales bacterium]
MIDLYTWGTPNGRKVSILLEELGLPYRVHSVHIGKDEQFAPDFLAIAPNNKIPAIVDHDNGLSLFESGAIMVYLAEKTGQFLPADPAARANVMQWLMWQMGGFGPMLGQAHFFLRNNRGLSEPAEQRFAKEAQRLYGVLDRQLEGNDYVAGDYSIADMAIFPWAARHDWHEVDLTQFPNVLRWYRALAERPAVQRGYQVPTEVGPIPMPGPTPA